MYWKNGANQSVKSNPRLRIEAGWYVADRIRIRIEPPHVFDSPKRAIHNRIHNLKNPAVRNSENTCRLSSVPIRNRIRELQARNLSIYTQLSIDRLQVVGGTGVFYMPTNAHQQLTLYVLPWEGDHTWKLGVHMSSPIAGGNWLYYERLSTISCIEKFSFRFCQLENEMCFRAPTLCIHGKGRNNWDCVDKSFAFSSKFKQLASYRMIDLMIKP